jgi:hypothetical protein
MKKDTLTIYRNHLNESRNFTLHHAYDAYHPYQMLKPVTILQENKSIHK